MSFQINQIDLQDYNAWIGKSAADILTVVKQTGGWDKVFPKSTNVPMWLSRVRNFFNIHPNAITRQSVGVWCQHATKIPYGKYGTLSRIREVYKDDSGLFWYQTPPGGTIYHSLGSLRWDNKYWKITKNEVGGQGITETFKFLNMDGTGGSSELILRNFAALVAHDHGANFVDRFVLRDVHGGGKSDLGKVGQRISLQGRSVGDERFAASYNFGDFYMSSEEIHNRFDVKTHSTQRNFYVPVNQKWKLSHRIFPKSLLGLEIINSEKNFRFSH